MVAQNCNRLVVEQAYITCRHVRITFLTLAAVGRGRRGQVDTGVCRPALREDEVQREVVMVPLEPPVSAGILKGAGACGGSATFGHIDIEALARLRRWGRSG